MKSKSPTPRGKKKVIEQCDGKKCTIKDCQCRCHDDIVASGGTIDKKKIIPYNPEDFKEDFGNGSRYGTFPDGIN